MVVRMLAIWKDAHTVACYPSINRGNTHIHFLLSDRLLLFLFLENLTEGSTIKPWIGFLQSVLHLRGNTLTEHLTLGHTADNCLLTRTGGLEWIKPGTFTASSISSSNWRWVAETILLYCVEARSFTSKGGAGTSTCLHPYTTNYLALVEGAVEHSLLPLWVARPSF